MEGAERSSHYFMNVKDIINMAFGELDGNVVNFRLIRIVLYLLARQLRLLERRVEVSVPIGLMASSSSFSVTEVKVHTITKQELKKGFSSNKLDTEIANKKTSGSQLCYDKDREGSGHEDYTRTNKYSRENRKGIDNHDIQYGESVANRDGKEEKLTKICIQDNEYARKPENDAIKTQEDKEDTKSKSFIQSNKESKFKEEGKYRKIDKYSIEDQVVEGAKDKQDKKHREGNGIKLNKESKYRKRVKGKQPDQKRADSYEQPNESPTPMVSVEKFVTQYERILVVESASSEERSIRGGGTPRLSVVTQEEFTKLARMVDELYSRLQVGDHEDAQLMEDLYKRTSYTEAMVALQLSARLEATEKLLGRMVASISAIARLMPGLELDDEIKAILETHGGEISGKDVRDRQIAKQEASPRKVKETKLLNLQTITKLAPIINASEESIPATPPVSIIKTAITNTPEKEGLKKDCVTYMDLDAELRKLSNDMMKEVTAITTRNMQTADRAFKIASSLEGKLNSSLDVRPQMVTLETQVAAYADQINALDTGLTSQMINYQEQLTQMQHELEIGLEAMSEALANAQGADTIAVAELNTNFINLQTEQETMTWQQRNLQQSHDLLASDLASLWKQIELLRDTKSDRDEINDALRDKAGIKDLNGLVSLEQFDAVRNDLEKQIAAAYDKFNNQEIIWQKAIDDMLRELGEKADLIQLYGLKDEITKYLNIMKNRIKIISDIVGEPKAAIVTKTLFRDALCISCSSPATMKIKEFDGPPALPKLPDRKVSTNMDDATNQVKGDGDHKICYPGLPIPHLKHSRAHVCTRYCGGSHTLIPSGPSRIPPSTFITSLARDAFVEQGVDGKMIQVEKAPCLPCNLCDCGSLHSKTPIHDGIPVVYDDKKTEDN